MRWWVLILTISLCAATVLLVGCGSESEIEDPPIISDSYEWGEFLIGGKKAILYADQEFPNVTYTKLIVYFPSGTPSNPESINAKLTLNTFLEDISMDNLENTIFENLPSDSYVLGAPVENPAEFNSNEYFYTTYIAPYVEGDWSFEFVWESPEVNARAFLPIEVESNPNYRSIITAGSWRHMIVLAWLEPKQIHPGPQSYKIKSWRSTEGSHTFLIDSTLTLELSVLVNDVPGYVPYTSVAKYHNGSFVGNITLPPDSLKEWQLKAITFDDTILVAEAFFSFSTSSYLGE